MNLVIDYFQFGSDPLALALSSDIADKSVTIYTDDGTTKTYITSFPFDSAFHYFTIDDGSTNFRVNFDPLYGFFIDCYDADDNFIAINVPVFLSPSFLPLIYPYDQNGSLITETNLDDVAQLVYDKGNLAINKIDDVQSDVSNISNDISNIGNNFDSINNKADGVVSSLGSIETNLLSYKNEVVSAVSDATCEVDISSINDSLDDKFAIIDSKLNSNFVNFINELNEKYTAINNSLSSVSFSSLNGSAGTYRDGTLVNVTGLSGDYTVLSSQMMKNDENQYIVIYKLDKDGSVGLFPSVMITVSGS